MPSDEALLADEGALADRFDALIEEISHELSANTPDAAEEAEVVRVVADSFGLGGGMGVYWGTLHLIERCRPSIALPIIQDRVIHGQAGSRRWCCFILGRRRNTADLPLFLALLNDSQSEVLAQALQSLAMLAQAADLKDVRPSVSPYLEHPDAEVRKAAQRAVETIGV
jgi:HEAT repeat protein